MGNPKSLTVLALVDPMSAGVYDYDTDKEYDEIQKSLSETLGVEIAFTKDIYPHNLKQRPFDIYVFDYGGMMPGCEDTIASLYREIIRAADEHPSSAFLMYSHFSSVWYSDLIAEESPGLSSQPNVFMSDNFEKLKEWLGI